MDRFFSKDMSFFRHSSATNRGSLSNEEGRASLVPCPSESMRSGEGAVNEVSRQPWKLEKLEGSQTNRSALWVRDRPLGISPQHADRNDSRIGDYRSSERRCREGAVQCSGKAQQEQNTVYTRAETSQSSSELSQKRPYNAHFKQSRDCGVKHSDQCADSQPRPKKGLNCTEQRLNLRVRSPSHRNNLQFHHLRNSRHLGRNNYSDVLTRSSRQPASRSHSQNSHRSLPDRDTFENPRNEESHIPDYNRDVSQRNRSPDLTLKFKSSFRPDASNRNSPERFCGASSPSNSRVRPFRTYRSSTEVNIDSQSSQRKDKAGTKMGSNALESRCRDIQRPLLGNHRNDGESRRGDMVETTQNIPTTAARLPSSHTNKIAGLNHIFDNEKPFYGRESEPITSFAGSKVGSKLYTVSRKRNRDYPSSVGRPFSPLGLKKQRIGKHAEYRARKHTMDVKIVESLFFNALHIVMRHRKPPFNISTISDCMSDITEDWSIKATKFKTFFNLCNEFVSRGLITLGKKGECCFLDSTSVFPSDLSIQSRSRQDLSARRRREEDIQIAKSLYASGALTLPREVEKGTVRADQEHLEDHEQ